MTSRTKQKTFGLVVAIIGLAGTIHSWYLELSSSYVYDIGNRGSIHQWPEPKLAILMPISVVIGTALIFLLPPREERMARGEDIAGLKGWEIITPRWKIILIVALAFGFGNLIAITLHGAS